MADATRAWKLKTGMHQSLQQLKYRCSADGPARVHLGAHDRAFQLMSTSLSRCFSQFGLPQEI